jgi:serine/threonine protein kinase
VSRFGPAYLGRDPSTNTRVVIRTFDVSPEWREFGEVSDLLNAFRKLCETTLDHPSLPHPRAFGAEGDIPYLVYPDLAGTTMDAVIRQDGPRPVAEVLQRARQLADAIDFAARAGVHHGMMAPCDVFLDGARTKVTGFGLAQAFIKVGIPAEAGAPYGSAQRLAGAPPTIADDIYSLAAITLELLIGTPPDPIQSTSPALREAQGLLERRRVQRPAPHETRVFTAIAGVDAGKLRAAFAAAFSDEPNQRPSTASEFVESLQDAISIKREMDEPTPGVVALPVFRDERKNPPSASVLDMEAAEDGWTSLEPPRRAPIVADRRETPAKSQPRTRGSQALAHEPRERKRESRVVRLEPVVDDAFLAEVAPPPARSIDEAPYVTPGRVESRGLLVAVVVAVSFAAGLAGGLIIGQRSSPTIESIIGSHESVAASQPTRAATEDPAIPVPNPLASTPPTVPPESDKTASSPEPNAAPVAPEPSLPAVEPGRLLVRSTPAGAQVLVDGRRSGVTPLDLRELAFGAHTIEVSHPGYDTRRQQVIVSERRPTRSVDFELRPAGAPADATEDPELNAVTAPHRGTAFEPGRLIVRSTPAGANVVVDSRTRGVTPLVITELAFGIHTIEVTYPGQATRWLRVTLSERRAAQSVDFDFRPTIAAAIEAATATTGSLQVASRPTGGKVFVDDSFIGTTPLLLSNVQVGSRHLKVEMPGYKPWTSSVQIEPGARSRVTADLEQ